MVLFRMCSHGLFIQLDSKSRTVGWIHETIHETYILVDHVLTPRHVVEQLLAGTMPLKAISDFCGFENPNSLRKFFKAQTGMTMTAWRLLLRNTPAL